MSDRTFPATHHDGQTELLQGNPQDLRYSEVSHLAQLVCSEEAETEPFLDPPSPPLTLLGVGLAYEHLRQ